MSSEEIYCKYGQELYFFFLKKVKSKDQANDILQSTFLKIHQHIDQLKSMEKARAWAFQIGRNEIINHFNRESSLVKSSSEPEEHLEVIEDICCFDKFVNDLPEIYREVVELIFIEGKKHNEVSDTLEISLANVKARVRRSKELLKARFLECCQYELNREGKLIGNPSCC